MRGFFPLCHRFFSLWHYGIADQHMTTAIGGGFLSLNKTTPHNARFLFRVSGHLARGAMARRNCSLKS
jgi:hypothetical protein